MSKDKISSQEMVEQIAAKLSVSKRIAEDFLKSLFAEIEETLLKGEPVKIKNLGTFKMQWNEPRKSVNVQTGEVFTIEGYNKVTFTPDADLKEAVNEPYSHLEPVELDGQEFPSFEIEKPAATTPDTLRNLSEQASEIKDILSEINSLSSSRVKAPEPVDEAPMASKLDIPDYEIILIDEDDEVTPKETEIFELDQVNSDTEKPQIEPNEPIKIQEVETNFEQLAETVEAVEDVSITESAPKTAARKPLKATEKTTTEDETEDEIAEPFIIRKKKKSKGLRFLIGLIIVLLLVVGGFYATYLSASCVRCWIEYDLLSEANRAKMNEYVVSVKGWFTSDKNEANTEAIENDSNVEVALPDTISQTEMNVATQPSAPVDSLQQLFNTRREYNEFLGEEEITEGTRLTNIAQHYYGKKEFWVYIYEANRDNIVHPDRITTGTIVKVPKVDPRLIDKKNPRCLQKAKELHDLYVGKK